MFKALALHLKLLFLQVIPSNISTISVYRIKTTTVFCALQSTFIAIIEFYSYNNLLKTVSNIFLHAIDEILQNNKIKPEVKCLKQNGQGKTGTRFPKLL